MSSSIEFWVEYTQNNLIKFKLLKAVKFVFRSLTEKMYLYFRKHLKAISSIKFLKKVWKKINKISIRSALQYFWYFIFCSFYKNLQVSSDMYKSFTFYFYIYFFYLFFRDACNEIKVNSSWKRQLKELHGLFLTKIISWSSLAFLLDKNTLK